jgi:hypothetical protein
MVSEITLSAYHEAGHCVLMKMAGREVRAAWLSLGGCGGVASSEPMGASDVERQSLEVRAQENARLECGRALIYVAGLAAEGMVLQHKYKPSVDASAAHDVACLTELYTQGLPWTTWASDFGMFKACLTTIAEEALLREWDTVQVVAGLLKSRNRVEGHDLAPLGKIDAWLAKGRDWQATFRELVKQGNLRLGQELVTLRDQLELHAMQRRLSTRVEAMASSEPQPSTWHAPMVDLHGRRPWMLSLG